jgi:hypothetical protein
VAITAIQVRSREIKDPVTFYGFLPKHPSLVKFGGCHLFFPFPFLPLFFPLFFPWWLSPFLPLFSSPGGAGASHRVGGRPTGAQQNEQPLIVRQAAA